MKKMVNYQGLHDKLLKVLLFIINDLNKSTMKKCDMIYKSYNRVNNCTVFYVFFLRDTSMSCESILQGVF